MKASLGATGVDAETIKRRMKEDITNPAANLKRQFACPMTPDQIQAIEVQGLAVEQTQKIKAIRSLFATTSEDSLCLQFNINPQNYIRACAKLALLCETWELPVMQCFPQRQTWIPQNMTIDTTILYHSILGETGRTFGLDNKDALWRRVLSSNKKKRSRRKRRQSRNIWAATKKHERLLRFEGTIFTDGVSISIVKQSEPTRAGKARKKGLKPPPEFDYLHQKSPLWLENSAGKCVLIDPGRTDLIFGLLESSRPEAFHRKTFCYTMKTRKEMLRSEHLSELQRNLKTRIVTDAEQSLSNNKTMQPEKWMAFLSRYKEATPILREHYSQPIFRKLRLSRYIRGQKADSRLVNSMKTTFGEDNIYVIGDWSAPSVRFQEPIKGIGLKRKLRTLGLEILLIDEFKTSSFCPDCCGRVETFKRIPNPRPSTTRPEITCHGLLRCKSEHCQRTISSATQNRPLSEPAYRLWNRDLLATLNMRHILYGLRNDGEIPERFRRR